MATTTNGIYYPSDYNSAADVPEDMRKMAESIDKKVITDVKNIKEEQTIQNTNISNLQKDNSTNKADITNIKAEQTEQNTELEELRAENERLRQDLNGLPTGQAEGESIDLTDSADMRFGSFKISGNSKQETSAQSKNICLTDFSNWESGDYDGSTGAKANNTARLRLIELLPVNPSTTYYLNLYNSNDYKFIIRIYDANKKFTRSPGAITNGETITTTESEYYIAVIIYNTTTTVTYDTYQTAFKNSEIKPFICLDSETDKSYDEYSVASPSLDYPSEVESCGDNVNLFDINNLSIKNTNGIDSASLNNNILTLVSKSGAEYVFNGYILSNLNIGQSYTVSFDYTTTAPSTRFLIRGYKEETKTLIGGVGSTTEQQGKVEITFDTSSDYDTYVLELYVTMDKTEGYTATFTNIKLEKGTKTRGYSKYGQGCINEVICNKNLFDKNSNEIVKNSFINTEGNLGSSNIGSVSNFINCKENKEFVISRGVYEGYTNRIVFFDENKNVLSAIENTSETYTFTTPQNTKYLRFQFPTSNVDTIQLEEGTTATEIIEHQSQTRSIPTQQPMRSVGDVRDTFVKINNKWFERHNIFRQIYTGNEGWKYLETYSNDSCKCFYVDGLKNMLNAILKSNLFKNEIDVEVFKYSINKMFTQIGNYFYINVPSQKIGDLASLQTFLQDLYNAGTPVYVDYILATPNDIECTEEQAAILDEIENTVKSYKGGTHIRSTDNVGAYVEVIYRKDLDTIINNLNTALIAMGGV